MVSRISIRTKLSLISVTVFLTSLIYYGVLAANFPVLFNVDNYENFAATRYIAEHHRIPVVTAQSDDIRFTDLGTTRLLRPPFSYLISAAVFRLSEPVTNNETTRLRLGSPFIAAVTLLVVFAGFYIAFHSIGLALLGTVAIALLPRFMFLATCNNDDIGAVFSASFLFSTTLALQRYGAKFHLLVMLAGAFGLVLQTKFTAWLILPWFALYVAVLLRNEWRRLLSWLPVLLVTFIIAGGWWLAFNMVNYGVGDPSAMLHAAHIQSELTNGEPNRRGYHSVGVGVVDLLANHDQFLSKSYRSLIGYLDWVKLDVGSSIYMFYGLILVIGLISVAANACSICIIT